MSKKVEQVLRDARSLGLSLEVEILLQDYLGVDGAGLFLKRGEELDDEICKKLKADISELERGYPLAYIRSKADFFGLEFLVNENVLIPRRETEVLVENAISCIQKLNSDLEAVKMVELGVGSGCISISVAKNFVHVNKNDTDFSHKLAILGVEKSREALEIARENVKKYGLENIIELREGDLLTGISSGADEQFDILVANLPYVDEESEVGLGVREFEPYEALFAEERGLALYREVLEQICAKKSSVDGGFGFKFILFEIGFDQAKRMRELCEEFGFTEEQGWNVEVIKDLEGRGRVIRLDKKEL
ncbi:peptide chain release factor N(5)-glutamine methyltransferase [Candidatus Peregrinibacteria bacterium]|jgi:release factor glutamine methyltransferase|nr:peptide chain release factor N(5)-glutamine methyltransferase [Candidatus Peregrinibacteria bacterium]